MVLEIKEYENFEEAFGDIMDKDADYAMVKHELAKGESVREHLHPDAEEWIVFREGEFKMIIDFDKEVVRPADNVRSVYLPKSCIHGMKCLTDITYFVLKSGSDRIIYLDDIMERKKSLEPIQDSCGTLWPLYKDNNISLAYVDVTGTAKEHGHRIMEEKYRIEMGDGLLILDDKEVDLRKGDVISIPKDNWHYLKNTGTPLEVLVLNCPPYDTSDFIPRE
jgi:mannose-6-phosphate isomerase-like protein (cupin superfamily)